MSADHHENRRIETDQPRASNRSVGMVLAVVFSLIGFWPLINDSAVHIWALAIAAGLLVLALVLPRALTPVAWAWLGLGHLLHLITSPIVLSALYFFAVVPTGIYLKITGKDPLRLKADPEADTYWIDRTPPGPDPKSLHQQF
ncbi:MAG: SxtJ family membrane protein [Rhodospirillaceae bacterium]